MNCKMLKAAFAGLVLSISGLANAVLIEAELTDDFYITINEYDWAWAAAVTDASNLNSLKLDLSYQAQFGWRIALTSDFLRDLPTAASFGTTGNFKCAAEYFSNSDLCNYSDGESRFVLNYAPNPSIHVNSDVWVIRSNVNTVPEPSTLAIFGLALFGLVSRKLKKQ